MTTKEKKAPEKKMVQGELKKYKLFQIMLADHVKAKLEKKLKVKKVKGVESITSFLSEILSEKSPAVQFREEIELTEQLLSLYKDAANMYSLIDNPGNCQDGYYVCTLNGQSTCCKGTMQLLQNSEVPILYWNCNVTVYQTFNSNEEFMGIEVDEVLLRPKSGIKILDLNKIENIKTIHFGTPYDIFIDL